MDDIVEMFRRVKVAESEADVNTVRALFAEDATLYEPYLSGTKQGPEVATYIGTLCGTEIAAVEFTILGAIVDRGGDRAAIELTELVTRLDGKKVELSNCTIVERRNGQFTRWHEYLQPIRRKP